MNTPAQILTISSGTITSGTTNPSSGSYSTGQMNSLYLDVNVTAISGTSPSYQLAVDRLGNDGIWYNVYLGSSITSVTTQSVTLGVGASTNVGFGNAIRVREVLSGTSPSVTRSVSLSGK